MGIKKIRYGRFDDEMKRGGGGGGGRWASTEEVRAGETFLFRRCSHSAEMKRVPQEEMVVLNE